MRILSWNILAGGGSRCRSIVETLRRYDADVIALQETVTTRAADLCHALGRDGYARCFSAPRGPRDRGLCVLSRVPARRVIGPAPPQAGIYPLGWLELDLPGCGVRLAAVYGPAAGPVLPAFWNATAAWLARRLWRREHGDSSEYTWFSSPGGGRAGRGFRIDHAFDSPTLEPRKVASADRH